MKINESSSDLNIIRPAYSIASYRSGGEIRDLLKLEIIIIPAKIPVRKVGLFCSISW